MRASTRGRVYEHELGSTLFATPEFQLGYKIGAKADFKLPHAFLPVYHQACLCPLSIKDKDAFYFSKVPEILKWKIS